MTFEYLWWGFPKNLDMPFMSIVFTTNLGLKLHDKIMTKSKII